VCCHICRAGLVRRTATQLGKQARSESRLLREAVVQKRAGVGIVVVVERRRALVARDRRVRVKLVAS
jgi:hypothetical protein